ncbi:unnamed protein product [Caenorhabditis angaria]|uniref:Carboxypeptidase n=1 Tax=Caenorhabditis angaria TaxID=860376 RepID=A0A9P1J1W4_9PELO|nr:unnamed protein product [Caenorhabditis angaria]
MLTPIFLALIFCSSCLSSRNKLEKLPGLYFHLYSDHYTGFLNVTDDERLFYWFMESQNTPSVDPLIFWFNGGPGCSSLTSLITELGPMLLDKTGENLKRNEYSWNRMASVVFLESPTGVGFSYTETGEYPIPTDDFLTAKLNYDAVKLFFKEFPEYRNHDVFISGESYGGIYVPMLVDEILNGQKDFPINLKGMLIGNGLLDKKLAQQTRTIMSYGRGFITESIFENHLVKCCNGSITCKDTKIDILDCSDLPLPEEWDDTFYDRYNLYRKCVDLDCGVYPHTIPESFFNSKRVRRTLQIPHDKRWRDCDDLAYDRNLESVKDQILRAAKNGVRSLIYFGDADLMCNFIMGQKFVAKLGLKKLSPKKPWFFKQHHFSGTQTIYENLKFVTIHGASHSAPETHPAECYHILQQFLKDQDI